MAHQFRRYHFSTSVSLNGTKIQENVVGMLAELKSRSIASLRNETDPFVTGEIYYLHHAGTHVVAWNLYISNEMPGQILHLEKPCGVPI